MKKTPYKQHTLRKALSFFLVCLGSSFFIHAQEAEFDWAVKMGGGGLDQAAGLTVDHAGNVYSTGFYNGTVDFDPGSGVELLTGDSTAVIPNFMYQYSSNVFVSKLNASGELEWAKGFSGPVGGDRLGKGIAVDDSGYVYITGGVYGTINFDNITHSVPGFSVYVAKLDPSGSVLWAKTMGGSSNDADYGTVVDVDALGNVYTTGFFQGTLTLDTLQLVSQGGWDVFVCKMDGDGNVIWAKSAGSSGDDMGMGLKTDAGGNVYISGQFREIVDFDPGSNTYPLTSNGFTDGFVWKLDSAGNFKWAKQIGDVGFDDVGRLALDPAGHVYVIGGFQGTVDFDPGTGMSNLTTNGMRDAFILKLDTAGDFSWAKTIGGTENDQGGSVAVDAAGNVYANGYFMQTVDFDPGTNTYLLTSTPADKQDMFFLKLDAGGNFSWAKSIALAFDYGRESGIAVDRWGNVHIAGTFGDDGSPASPQPGATVDFDPGPDTFNLSSMLSTSNFYGYDAFILKLACHPDSAAIAVTNCEPYTINGETFTQTGIYTTTFTGSHGCDSMVTIDLIIDIPEAVITINVDTLSTTQSFSNYQWLKDGVLISGATHAKYTVSENADYQVIVTNEHGCIDTSEVYAVTNHGVGIHDIAAIGSRIRIYPNPAHDLLHIQSPVAGQAVLTDLRGRTILKVNELHAISLKDQAKGVYFLSILDKEERLLKVEKVVKW